MRHISPETYKVMNENAVALIRQMQQKMVKQRNIELDRIPQKCSPSKKAAIEMAINRHFQIREIPKGIIWHSRTQGTLFLDMRRRKAKLRESKIAKQIAYRASFHQN